MNCRVWRSARTAGDTDTPADIISAVTRSLKNEGCPAVHLLAARANRAAVRTYEKLGFELCGECRMYDIDFYMYEKLL